MSFTSFTFLFYGIPLIWLITVACPMRFRRGLLMIISLLYYGWMQPLNIAYLIGLILYTYACGKWIDRVQKQRRNVRLWISCMFLLGILLYFKYAQFLYDQIAAISDAKMRKEALFMPLGTSFILFQALSYLIDIKKQNGTNTSFLACGEYLTFFPKLIMGPIVPYHRFIADNQDITITKKKMEKGSRLFVIGLAQKVILADHFAQLYALTSADLSVLGSWLSSFAFTMQIYFDFAGYSAMAVGMASLLGYELPQNFNDPYLAVSIRDFWHRWHISLSQWFRDYVYIPLGGNRKGIKKHIRNLLIVWCLTGLWHGSTWNFLLWGMYYGLLQIVELYIGKNALFKRFPIIGWLMTFLLVNFGWVLFAYGDSQELFAHIRAMIPSAHAVLYTQESLCYCQSYAVFFLLALLCIVHVEKRIRQRWQRRHWYGWMESLAYTLLLLVSLCFTISAGFESFLYMQF